MSQIELIPYSVVESLITKLKELKSHNFKEIHAITEKLENLRERIEILKARLSEFSKREFTPEMKACITKLKELLHVADDFFDEIATEILLHGTGGGKVRSLFSSCSTNEFVYQSRRIAREIDEIEEKFKHAVQEMETLPPTKIYSQQTIFVEQRIDDSPTHSNESDIIGREKEKREILSILKQPGKDDGYQSMYYIIGIAGIAGIGKTALAKMVYQEARAEGLFDIYIWVTASPENNTKIIAETISDSLNGKRYLLVLDDVTNGVYSCDDLMTNYLTSGSQGLHWKDSWMLLKKLAFRNHNNEELYHVLEPVGKKIAIRCGGVPQTIIRVADMLYMKYTESEWIDFLEADFFSPTSLSDNNIMSKFASDLEDLTPCQLKECLSYCLIYPRGWRIEKNEIIQIWMSQGYLDHSNGDGLQEMEDVGNKFVYALQCKYFFQEEKYDGDYNLVSFKIHDLIHHLVLNWTSNDYYLDGERRVEKPIHMCFSLESNKNLLDSIDASRLRTFFLQRKNDRGTAHILTRELSFILKFKRLRVLNLSHSSLNKLPDLISKLKHLRYLDLSWCVKLTRLPKSICNLVNLETLKLTGCAILAFPTEVVTKFIHLRHLEIHRCKAFEDMMPAGLAKLSSLQSLSNFYVVADQKKKAGKLNELQNINNLRGNLQISALDQVKDAMQESQDVNLKEKKLLESLDLNWEKQDNVEISFQLLKNLCPHENLKRLNVRWYPGDKFPDWLSNINHLSHISLFGFNNCKSLPPIEHLPKLKSLVIGSMKVLEYIYFKVVSATFFPSLETLKISGCPNFKGWKSIEGDDVSIGHLSKPPRFYRLTHLIINKCPKLTCLPTFPIVGDLQLCESLVKPLKETLEMIGLPSYIIPLSFLTSLKIEGKLEDIIELPSQWKKNLFSLKSLEIGDVDNLDIWFDHQFPSVVKVVIYGCDFKSLPLKMCDVLSLQHIKIMGCHKLESLPKEMVKLTNLVTLEIWDCPLLVERCQRETGVDWPQISKVKNLILKQNLRR